MRAAVYERYGPPEVVELREIETPEPKDDEVLIKVRATTVTRADHRMRAFDVPTGFGPLMRLALGVRGPRQRVLGSELAGDVVAVGERVRSFKVGDPVFAFPDLGLRCHAEYRCMPESGAVVPKPSNLTYEQAAALSFAGTAALGFLRQAKIERGETVLVNGASGAVGTACVRLARHLGAEVTGVCSTANVGLVRSVGAAHVIDYTAEDFTRSGRTYDVIVDTVGTAPLSRSRASLSERGRLVLILATLPQMLGSPWASLTSKKKVIVVGAGRADDLRSLARLAETGEFTPVIDRSYPFERIVEAHRYVDTGHKRGSVVITL
jgi:NADPH:quinone reductase-like Zn-dependent oxidoreductase